LVNYLTPLYREQAGRIKAELEAHARTIRVRRSATTRALWYKKIQLYTVYPDGIRLDPARSPLGNLLLHLPLVRKLHCNALHILPFCDSPQVDKGFDVRDHYRVRPDLGTLEELQELIAAADQAGIKVFMDLIVNHVSDQHDWFKRAQEGDPRYQDYFITTRRRPEFLRRSNQADRVVAIYNVANKKLPVEIVFPEFAGAFPHWREGPDGLWYYHTYYPQEVDLNWMNPEVFLQFGRILMFWASQGFHFRLDAIPYIGKAAYKVTDDDNSATHLIAAALRCISDRVHLYSANLVESFETLPTIIDYFGTTRHEAAQLSYNFHLCTSTWLSLCTGNADFIWHTQEHEKLIPAHAQWLNFLRNHDELSLAHLVPSLARTVRSAVLRGGRDFRHGHGIAGRTAALLGGDPRRLRMAHVLLASLPGGLMVMYGDEIGAGNVAWEKLSESERQDPRNINRGTFTAADYRTGAAAELVDFFKELLGLRERLADAFTTWPERIGQRKSVYAARYRRGGGWIQAFVNLSGRRAVLAEELGTAEILMSVNEARQEKGRIYLGPYGCIWLQRVSAN
jgi:maltose alpha-D-glucosyltransferase/alpha-amylase